MWLENSNFLLGTSAGPFLMKAVVRTAVNVQLHSRDSMKKGIEYLIL